MKDQGFTFRSPHAPSATSTAATEPFDDLPYGLVDVARATRYAYSNPPQPAMAKQGLIRGAAPDRYDVALDGASGTSGCQGQADRRLAPQLSEQDSALPAQLDQESYEQAATDPAVERATTAWSRCMAAAGDSFDTPFDAASAAWPERPDAAEIATALADVRCKQGVDWLGTWRGAQASRELQAIAAHRAAFARIDAAWQRQLTAATAILRGQA